MIKANSKYLKLQVILRVGPNQVKKTKIKHAFILFLIVIILSTYGNLHAYPYGYHLFVSKMLSLTWFNAKNKSNLILVLIAVWHKKAQLNLCKCVDLAEPSMFPYTKNRCR